MLMAITVMLAPESAQANLEGGHPEAYSNNVKMTSKVSVVGHGPVHWSSEALGANIECIQIFWGDLNNEGVPLFGTGQILGWNAQGDATVGGAEIRRSCKFTKTGVEGEPEAWITDEPALETTHRTPPSVPWNMRYSCDEFEGTKRPLLKIGVPAGAPAPSVGCTATEAERAAEIEKEETERTGCYATTVPEGCISLTWVSPALGLEAVFQGSEQAVWRNPAFTGLHLANWELTGPQVGKLHLAGSFSTTATGSGGASEGGFMAQFLTVK
jgi:hypothetical protein